MKTFQGGVRAACAAGVLLFATAAPAMDHSKMNHDMSAMPGMAAPSDAAAHHGGMIREATVDGRRLMYHLMTWEQRNQAMKGMEGMEMAGMDNSGQATNHLMLYVTGPDGKAVAGAKVGFALTRPDGTEQKTLTMAMSGGYGADVVLKAKGAYKIKSKIVAGDVTTVDEFTYEVK
jgi:hypothetical protein